MAHRTEPQISPAAIRASETVAERIYDEVMPCRHCGSRGPLLTLWESPEHPRESSCFTCGSVLWVPAA